MARKPFYVDIDLNNNKLQNTVVGLNSAISTTEGAINYESGNLQYKDAIRVQNVASEKFVTDAIFAAATSGTVSADNGLTKTGSNVALGGALTASTTLTLGDNNLTISAASTQGYGLKYAADYSSQYTSRSLVDKAYVDTHFTAGNTARTIGFSTDGNGQVISVGIKGYIVAGFTGTITGWDVVADKVGTIIVDIWKGTGSVPTVANSITGSQKPTLASTQFNSSTDVSTWTPNVTLGDIIVFNVTGATLITKVTVTIRMIQ